MHHTGSPQQDKNTSPSRKPADQKNTPQEPSPRGIVLSALKAASSRTAKKPAPALFEYFTAPPFSYFCVSSPMYTRKISSC